MGVLAVAWVVIRPTRFEDVPKKREVFDVAPATAPAVASRPVVPAAKPRTSLVTKCLGPRGIAAYTDGNCPAGSRPTAAELPALTIADGLTQDQRLASQQADRIQAQQVLAQELRVVQDADRIGDECGALNAAVAAYDAQARQPLPVWRQDQLREMRKAARDRQFSLRCR